MQREIFHYIEYLAKFREVNRPKMPKFDVGAYTDIEYQNAIFEINNEFDKIDDFGLYEEFLKGE